MLPTIKPLFLKSNVTQHFIFEQAFECFLDRNFIYLSANSWFNILSKFWHMKWRPRLDLLQNTGPLISISLKNWTKPRYILFCVSFFKRSLLICMCWPWQRALNNVVVSFFGMTNCNEQKVPWVLLKQSELKNKSHSTVVYRHWISFSYRPFRIQFPFTVCIYC